MKNCKSFLSLIALFTDKSHVLSVVAETPCLVIQVTLDDLEDMKIQVGHHIDANALGWGLLSKIHVKFHVI